MHGYHTGALRSGQFGVEMGQSQGVGGLDDQFMGFTDGLEAHYLAHAVHVPGHQVATQTIGQAQGQDADIKGIKGSSTISDRGIVRSVNFDFSKVNFCGASLRGATGLQPNLGNAFKGAIYDDASFPEGFDPKLFLKPAREAVTALVCERIAVLGSNSKI